METLKFSYLQQLFANHGVLDRLCDNHQHFPVGLISAVVLSTSLGQIEGRLEPQGYHFLVGWHELI